jgi:hypothetical protein
MSPPSSTRNGAGAVGRSLAKKAYRAVVGPPPVDAVRAWPGTARDGLLNVRVLHVGDCGVRRMELSHDLYAPPGYPLAAAERLLEHGIGIEFSHYFSVRFEHLPDMPTLRRRMRLTGDPDMIVIQVGAAYTRRILLPDTPRIHQLRDDVGRRAGRLVPLFYRVLRPCLRLFGRHSADYVGAADLERFVDSLRRVWPDAEIVLVTPFRRSPGYAPGEPIAAQVEADLYAIAAARYGVWVFDANDVLGRDPSLRCVTGYNLTARASGKVGEKLAGLILERYGAGRPPEAAAATPAARRSR